MGKQGKSDEVVKQSLEETSITDMRENPEVTGEKLQGAKNIHATIYTSALCPVCGMVKGFLDSFDVPYKEVNVDINPIAMLKLIAKTKKLSVPQTYINGKWISGFDPEKMLQTLNG